jgi:hypothetical protein
MATAANATVRMVKMAGTCILIIEGVNIRVYIGTGRMMLEKRRSE